jgi:hypothetical protein
MKSLALATLAVASLASVTAGCDDDCTRLADAVCARTGASHATCQALRSRSENTTQDDRRACGKALQASELLTPKG